MAVPGAGGELQAPGFVCDSCGALFHHRPESCIICFGGIRTRDINTAAIDNPQLDTRRRRITYGLVGFWVVLLSALVVYTARQDPTLGHAGRMVYPDEAALEKVRHSETPDPVIANRTFRLMKSDRIERVGGPPSAVPDEIWIRVTGGPHVGRTGVVIW